MPFKSRGCANDLPTQLACRMVALILGMLCVPSGAQAATDANAQSPLGINLAGVNYYTPEQPFLNIIRTAERWITHSPSAFDSSEEPYLNLDSNGWPVTLTAINNPSAQQFDSVGVLVLRLSGYPTGQYVVLYDGQGTLSYGFDASLVSRSPGRDVINVAAATGGGIDLRIIATDPKHSGNYVRNIRLVKAENEAALNSGQVFNPAFLNVIQKFRALRFMDWFQTNGSTLSSWSSRPLPSQPFWGTSAGVPIELAIQLSNATGADAWLNVPHMADDNYMTQMASLAHLQLGVTQKAYVELSNEVWNGAFPQYQYSVSQGQSLWPKQPGGGGGWEWGRNWYGMRTAQMCDIWKSVWGDDASRVVCVLGSQAAGGPQELMNCPYWSGGPCYKHIDAVAIAPYFGYGVPAAWTSQPDGGLTSLFQSLYSQNDPSIPVGGDLAQASQWEASYVSYLSAYKLPLIAYEGGQSFANGSTDALTNLYFAANRDPRMGAVYTAYLQQWKSNGGRLFMIYNDVMTYGRWGEWGALESLTQASGPLSSTPPKWQAIQNFIATNLCWWPACAGTRTPPSPKAPTNLTVH